MTKSHVSLNIYLSDTPSNKPDLLRWITKDRTPTSSFYIPRGTVYRILSHQSSNIAYLLFRLPLRHFKPPTKEATLISRGTLILSYYKKTRKKKPHRCLAILVFGISRNTMRVHVCAHVQDMRTEVCMQFEALLVHLGCCSLGYFPWKLVIFPPARWHAPIKYPWAMHSFTNILPLVSEPLIFLAGVGQEWHKYSHELKSSNNQWVKSVERACCKGVV